jgi:hypothetical protein
MPSTKSPKHSVWDLLRKSLCAMILLTSNMARRLRESFRGFNLEFKSLRVGRTMQFEVKSVIILDRPLIPVYIGNVQEIRG